MRRQTFVTETRQDSLSLATRGLLQPLFDGTRHWLQESLAELEEKMNVELAAVCWSRHNDASTRTEKPSRGASHGGVVVPGSSSHCSGHG